MKYYSTGTKGKNALISSGLKKIITRITIRLLLICFSPMYLKDLQEFVSVEILVWLRLPKIFKIRRCKIANSDVSFYCFRLEANRS